MQKIDLSILPQGGINPVVRCSQGDVGRQFQIELYNETMTAKYVLDGTEELSFEGIKPDGNIFQYDITPQSGSTVTISTTEQMTAVYGDVICELRILEAGGGSILGTANITLCVEIGPSSHDIVSASAIMLVDEVRGYMEDARQYSEDSKAWAVGPNGSGSGTDTNNSKYHSEQSANSATASANSADDSKAWAVGPNGSGSGTDSNNSKFYSQQSASSASSASSSASDSKAWAVGPSGTGSGTDSNNAKYYAGQAATSASDASDYKDAAVGAASASASSATDSKNWAVGPSGSGSGTDTNNSKYYATQSANSASDASSAKDDAVTAKNAAESAQQKIENMTASASGLPAGSSPTVTKTEVGGVVNLGFGIPKGDKGDTGNDGVSPTASVTQTDPDTVTFTVTDRQGTTTATLSAGGAPALSGLSDVNLTTPSDGQALVYDNNSSKWVNGQAGVAAPYPYGARALRAGKITGYNGSSESINEMFNPVTDITVTDNVAWFLGMPIVFFIENANDNIHYECELVDYKVTMYYGGNSYDERNPAYCMHFIAETVASGEEGLAYDFELYFLIPDDTGRLVKVNISYDSYGNMTSHTTTYVSIASSGGGGGANETYIDWSQNDNYRWRVSRFWDDAYSTGVEIEISTSLLGVWSDSDVVYGNSLVSDYDNRKYQLIQIDVPLSSLVHPDANGDITAIVDGTTYTFNINTDISSYSNCPFLVQFSPTALFGSLPNPTFLQKSAGVEGISAYSAVAANGPVIRLSFYLRTDILINTFSDLMSSLGMSSWGGIFGPICGSISISKSKS